MFTKIADDVRAEFPYVSQSSTNLSPALWGIVLASVLVAVAILLFFPALFNGHEVATQFSILMFAALPIATLYFVSPDKGAGLFQRVTFKTVGQSIGLGVLTFVLSVSCALLMTQLIDTSPNHGIQGLEAMSGGQKIRFFLFSVPQLFGEEVITILPFLAIIYYCHHRFHWSQPKAVFLAWIITAVWFALIHLPAYNWNLLQVLWGVGFARLLLTAVYIITKNLWVSTGAHITNDWLMFVIATLSFHSDG
ncbi:CPBP family glutamic-type intramembrane protease [Neptunicella sp.]|uniref:CPBP family glutamic-type intramembrane protease n=1 Tax=Neptunicella sp. TaxID=2125986 RepID=UPI003F68BB4F